MAVRSWSQFSNRASSDSSIKFSRWSNRLKTSRTWQAYSSLFDYRLDLMLREENARFDDWDQDVTAIEKDYANADPAEVSAELTAEGEQIAASFGRVPEDQWGRTGIRSNGSEFTVLTFSQYFLHDVVHHLHDVDG